MSPRVGLVLVSHSQKLAEGLAELAAQMAPDVRVLPAGGLAGELGTDFEAVSSALDRAESGAGVVLLYDLGSAQMTAELAVEALGDPGRAHVVDAPLVEGAVAAAVAAQGGADLDGVSAAASQAAGGAPEAAAPTLAAPTGAVKRAEVLLTNEIGLHARPAALLARSVAELDAEIVVHHGDQQVDARSVLGLMALGARGGDRIEVTARGTDADEALRRITDLAERRFDE
ncbi:dihydroxyacetone kinase phosphoryl donor subunit DhaM [Goodfellowiella coeruleoviolacea]|uniref:Phosphocarrier protein HPr n=1 Tax=Goodfellowiella coeruleoviolacea TaxID=334858 RepID=A0AAE3KI11_9PSEU|nr:dihydroxyacetone kinase phosphoryl donor subunit DhaM [Goodfellowiella coeruleoviolacea]MCP2166969.1 PTS hybrid protein [Goodfellowiella coeruleoviolacea]